RLSATRSSASGSDGNAGGKTTFPSMMPVLPYEVSSPGPRRSTKATASPRLARCRATEVPTMPAPSTMASTRALQAPPPVLQRSSRHVRDIGQRRQGRHQRAGDPPQLREAELQRASGAEAGLVRHCCQQLRLQLDQALQQVADVVAGRVAG